MLLYVILFRRMLFHRLLLHRLLLHRLLLHHHLLLPTLGGLLGLWLGGLGLWLWPGLGLWLGLGLGLLLGLGRILHLHDLSHQRYSSLVSPHTHTHTLHPHTTHHTHTLTHHTHTHTPHYKNIHIISAWRAFASASDFSILASKNSTQVAANLPLLLKPLPLKPLPLHLTHTHTHSPPLLLLLSVRPGVRGFFFFTSFLIHRICFHNLHCARTQKRGNELRLHPCQHHRLQRRPRHQRRHAWG